MSKTYTATAVMQLVEQGIVELDAAVAAYLPDVGVSNPLGERPITVRDLLTHRSGLAENAAGSTFGRPVPLRDHLRQVYASGRNDYYYGTALPQWIAKVGHEVQYSNTGIATLGLLVETMNPEALSFDDYVERHIMTPLKMKDSSFRTGTRTDEAVGTEHSASTGYVRVGGVRARTPRILFNDGPAGSARVSAPDHLRLLLAYLNNGELDGSHILRHGTVEQMLSAQAECPTEISATRGADTKLGLVWWLSGHGADEHFHHTGAHMWGWTNVARAYPRLGLAIVVLSNQWSLHSDPQLGVYPQGRLIADFAARWIQHERNGVVRPGADHPWAWRASYYRGLTTAERMTAFLGSDGALDARTIDALAGSVVPDDDNEWREDGFRAGVEDLLATDLTLPGIRSFLRSPALRISPAELHLLHRELGALQGAPVLSDTW